MYTICPLFFKLSIPYSLDNFFLNVADMYFVVLKGQDHAIIIGKISSLSCQKVAESITSSKMGNNVAKQASVLLHNILDYIRRYPSTYCTI